MKEACFEQMANYNFYSFVFIIITPFPPLRKIAAHCFFLRLRHTEPPPLQSVT